MIRFTLVAVFLLAVFSSSGAAARAVLDTAPLPPGGETQVWSPIFQASWDKLNSQHAGKPGKVSPPNTLIAQLNEFSWKKDAVMPKGGYGIFVGPCTPEFAASTAAAIQKQFGVRMAPSRLPTTPGGNALYGILLRDLKFRKSFFRARKQPLLFTETGGKSHKVAFFGSIGKHSDFYGNNVKVLDYNKHGKSFILSIATDHPDEHLIIYQPDRVLSFKTAITHVNASIKAPLAGPYGSLTDGTLHKNDTVKIPYLTLKADTDFTSQLQGERHYDGEKATYEIKMAYQITRFALFEKGARIRVETGTGDGPFGDPDPTPKRVIYVRRNFIYEKPFFVFAWREKSPLPYFAAWIDGKEALTPFDK